jgi:polar amino acid transport system permease protein
MTGESFGFLLYQLMWTIMLSAIGFAGATPAGLAVALGRTASAGWVRHGFAGDISVFQGTPLLIQLFVVYYGLALVGLKLEAWVAVGIGFTLHASAYLGEIWRGAIEAVPRGQSEAATALGMGYVARMRKVVLPQAFRISLPATVGFLVQLIKGTSLAAIVGFTELARAASIVSNQTFKPLLIYGVAGLMYFVLCWPLSLWGSQLECRMATAAH